MTDDSAPDELKGVVVDDVLYLVSYSQGKVFASERGKDGKLQCVGKVQTANGKRGHVKIYRQGEGVARARTGFPFPADPNDHCETPLEAYEDLAPYLRFLARAMGKKPSELRIWDPFYCDGAVTRNMDKLGFHKVHNECVDFYTVIESGKLPEHDCIMTNPPYSTEPVDHVQRLVKILCAQSKPWFVVQPNYVYVKPFWVEYTSKLLSSPRPFFLSPQTPRKYKYKTPAGMRLVTCQQLKTSAFVSMWYCWLGPRYTEQMYRWIRSRSRTEPLPLHLACTEHFLPDCFKDSNDKSRRKPRKPKKRKIESHCPQSSTAERLHGNKPKQKRRRAG